MYRHTQVLRSVEKYIDSRWEPWRDVVKNETKTLVVEVCEVYSISEKVLGDLIDRKQAQVCCVCVGGGGGYVNVNVSDLIGRMCVYGYINVHGHLIVCERRFDRLMCMSM